MDVTIPVGVSDRAKEIEGLVASSELNLATKRLMDFVEDFAVRQSRKREVISIRGEFSSLSADLRLYGRTEELGRQQARLRKAILELLHLMVDESEVPPHRPPSAPSVQTLFGQEAHKLSNSTEGPSRDPSTRSGIDNATRATLQPNRLSTYTPPLSDIICQARGLTKAYRKGSVRFTLQPLDLTLRLGEITALVGENGSGKSTLLNILAGRLKADAGDPVYPGLDAQEGDFYALRQQIGHIPQTLERWRGSLVDNLHFAASIRGIKGRENEEAVEFMLLRHGLEEYKGARWSEISGGYKMRFAVAKTLLWKPKLLVLDEPLANLDVNAQLIFLNDLQHLVRSEAYPMAAVISSQHLHEVEGVADHIVFLKEGHAVYNGSMTNFGEDREENCFEIDCTLSKEQLVNALLSLDPHNVFSAGVNFIVYTDRTVDARVFLSTLLSQGVQVKHFRDISKSTRKLFEVEI